MGRRRFRAASPAFEHKKNRQTKKTWSAGSAFGASDEARTRYLHLGKVALYQMSYTRNSKVHYSTFFETVNPKIKFSRLFKKIPRAGNSGAGECNYRR